MGQTGDMGAFLTCGQSTVLAAAVKRLTPQHFVFWSGSSGPPWAFLQSRTFDFSACKSFCASLCCGETGGDAKVLLPIVCVFKEGLDKIMGRKTSMEGY